MNIAVVGAGFVGLTTDIALGERGHQIALVEVDSTRRERLSESAVSSTSPVYPRRFRNCSRRVASGTALHDAREPDRVVVGTADPLAEARIRELYGTESCPLIVTTLETAELIKYAANGMLDTRICRVLDRPALAQKGVRCIALGVGDFLSTPGRPKKGVRPRRRV